MGARHRGIRLVGPASEQQDLRQDRVAEADERLIVGIRRVAERLGVQLLGAREVAEREVDLGERPDDPPEPSDPADPMTELDTFDGDLARLHELGAELGERRRVVVVHPLEVARSPISFASPNASSMVASTPRAARSWTG